MPKSKSKSKPKTSTKQSQKQKQQIVVNVNSNNKRKSTHYHHKNSNNPPTHIVVPSTNHHMMFMSQPQGPPPNLLGDNNYGIGQNRLLDATLQRMNETIDQVQQNALNSSIQQNAIHDAQEQRRHEREQQYYRRDDYHTPSRGAGSSGNRSRTSSVHSEAELNDAIYAIYAQMQDINVPSLSSEQRNVLSNYIDQAQNQEPSAFAVVDEVPTNIIYHTGPVTPSFNGSIDDSQQLKFNAPRLSNRSLYLRDEIPEIYSTSKARNKMIEELENSPATMMYKSDVLDGLRHLGSINVKKKDFLLSQMDQSELSALGAPKLLTLENYYTDPTNNDNTLDFGVGFDEVLKDTPSKTVNKMEALLDASEENSEVLSIKTREQIKQEKQRKKEGKDRLEQQEIKQKLAEFEKQEEERERKVAAQTEELKRLRAQQHQGYTKASEADLLKKFDNPDEFINTYEELSTLTSGSSGDITPEVLQKYNKLRSTFNLGNAKKITKMDPIIKFLQDHNNTYSIIKKKLQPPTTAVVPSRYKPNNVTNATTLLTAEPKILPPIIVKGGGGGAKQKNN